MPVERVFENGKAGYRWGKHGKIYFYQPGDETSRKRAYAMAERQGRAARAGGYKG